MCDFPPKDQLKIQIIHIPCSKYDRNSIIKTIYSIPKFFIGFFKSIYYLATIKPDFVLSFGGYVSVPVVIAAKIFSVPSITHEQTSTISLSTKINSFFVNKVALSFPPKINNSKYIVTGNILRRQIFDTSSRNFLKIKKPIIYVTGGNQGSSFLNNIITKIIPKLSQYSIIHQTGSFEFGKYKTLQSEKYLPFQYINQSDIGWVLNNAEIIISRAGANTCQEIAILQKKSILIPLPNTQQNEQLLNAQWLKSVNPNTLVFSQSKINPDTLLASIKKLSNKIVKTKFKAKINHNLLNLIHETL